MYSPDTTKYLIHISLTAEGVVEKPDVVGAIFGQTEGLLGEDLDLRDLQRTGRVGRIDVQIASKKGETSGEILISTSLDRAETAILAASLETIDRVGPCVAHVSVKMVEDIRVSKRKKIVERAKEILVERFDDGTIDSDELLDDVRQTLRVEKIGTIGEEKLPAGPNVLESDAIIIVEGRADVINLLRYGIKNTVAVEGTNIPKSIVELTEKKTTTAFFDGDRGGELILRELLQVADIDFVAFSPRGKSVEDMSKKEVIKTLRNKVPVEYVRDQYFEDSAELPGDLGGRPARTAPAHDEGGNSDTTGKQAVSQKRIRDGTSKVPTTLRDHMDDVKGKNVARFLNQDMVVIRESRSEEVEKAVETLEEPAAGVVVDRTVDQKLLDRLVWKGLEYVAAKDFKGIIKRPLNIRLMKMSS
ncbi:TOPRIM domain protein [Methanoregula boonei 6A8]|uniref:DNA primase DnaG n=1 Tax=Methanoregula boonei (strain DSM 21154 / JCM 14090 / 6A8) TaxID=456442 RepID=DNAG_METB6|nr:DNA primase DnaG [Methanoregula boonei]A7I6K3.1 RecName: Full=DNA primase DnaG [Methanoregula boonei 6A8]ABS55364.1 TOPRIM domain protein [Methanoregula boonei 6A8]